MYFAVHTLEVASSRIFLFCWFCTLYTTIYKKEENFKEQQGQALWQGKVKWEPQVTARQAGLCPQWQRCSHTGPKQGIQRQVQWRSPGCSNCADCQAHLQWQGRSKSKSASESGRYKTEHQHTCSIAQAETKSKNQSLKVAPGKEGAGPCWGSSRLQSCALSRVAQTPRTGFVLQTWQPMAFCR